MRIYKYWALERGTVRFDQEEKEIRCYGGSNVSEADAIVQAREKIEKVKSKIAGDEHAFDTYEVEIREEIVREIDEKAIVTRNRYGAQVLNVQDLMILDIDKPKASFLDIFRRQADAEDKAKIIEQVRALSRKSVYQSCGFRIYETRNGIRVIVLGKRFDPQAGSTVAMMKEFNCDALYTLLCQKQACFRARMTPKSGRMKLRGYKVRFPRDAETEKEFQKWLAGYEAACRNFSVCRFVSQIGRGDVPEAVRFHDEITGVQWGQELA
jgi:hypothetical protein